MEVVIDASAILAVLLEEPERHKLIAATRAARLFAPASLPWEVGNGLVAAVRRRRLNSAQATGLWREFEKIPVRLLDVDVGQAIALAAESGIYAYDAYLLTLARRRGLPLLTLDKQLRAIAPTVGVTLTEY